MESVYVIYCCPRASRGIRPLALLFFLFSFFPLAGQRARPAPAGPIDVYPVRVDHKWGYVKIYPGLVATIIPPRYDFVGDVSLPWNTPDGDGEPSPYRVFELDGRVGLLDPALREALPNHYRRIRPVAPGYFAVEPDSLFILINAAGDTLLGGQRYDDICAAGQPSLFRVKTSRGWGLRDLAGRVDLTPAFAAIEPAGAPGFFKVKEQAGSRGWTLIDLRGRELLPGVYDDILALDSQLVAVRRGPWRLMRRTGRASSYRDEMRPFATVERLNDQLAALVALDTPRTELWNIARGAPCAYFTSRQYKFSFSPLEEPFALLRRDFQDGRDYRVVDTSGRTAAVPCDEFEPSGRPGLYRVRRRGRWGLLAPGRDSLPVLACTFDSLSPFTGAVAIARQGRRWGAVAATAAGIDTLLCAHDQASILDSGRVQVQLGAQVITYGLDDRGRFAVADFLDSVLLIGADSRQDRLREAAPVDKKRVEPYRPPRLPTGDIIRDWTDDHLRLALASGRQVYLPAGTPAVYEIIPEQVLAVYQRARTAGPEVLQMLPTDTLARLALYDVEAGAYLTDSFMLGLRAFPPEGLLTAFVDTAGRMGLIDRRGREASGGGPRRYTYIGPFVAGRARVCRGGRLVLDRRGDLPVSPKFRIGTLQEFLAAFHIKPQGKAGERWAERYLYAIGTEDDPCRWGYIDTTGAPVIDPGADFVSDFYEADSTAIILRQNTRVTLGVPDADYGVIDHRGAVLLEPQYSSLVPFADYFLVGVDSTPTFYFTKEGRELFVNPTRLRPFAEGLAQFRDTSGRWGYLDTGGRVAIAPRFTLARPFSGGLALVVDSSGFCSFIDTTGAIVFTTGFREREWRGIGDFHDGRCWFKKSGPDWLWGCFDRRGRVAIPPRFRYELRGGEAAADERYPLPMDFTGGRAAVVTTDSTGRLSAAVIDTSGGFVVRPGTHAVIRPFDAGGLAVFSANAKGPWGLLDRRGHVAAPPAFAAIEPFVNGYARVRDAEGRWGLLNRRGEEVIAPRYAAIDTVAEGLVAVRPPGATDWQFVDTLGEVNIPGPFRRTQPFRGGATLVATRDGNRIIDRLGREAPVPGGAPEFFSEGIFGIRQDPPAASAQPPRYYFADASGNNLFGRFFAEISPHRLGVARVRPASTSRRPAPELLGAVNRRGVLVAPAKFRYLHIQPDGNIIINPQRFYGLADKRGRLLIEPRYDRLDEFAELGIFRVERGEAVGYFRLVDNRVEWVWELQK